MPLLYLFLIGPLYRRQTLGLRILLGLGLCLGTFSHPALATGNLGINADTFHIVDHSVRPWIQSAIVVGAIKRQNAKYMSLSQTQIVELDQRWRDELAMGFGRQELVNRLLDAPLSRFLRQKRERSLGLFTELVVMDNKGLIVGVSQPVGSLWQGDKDIWQQSYGAGMNRTYIGNIQRQPGSHSFQIHISYSITDPDSGKTIGAIAVGVNVEKLIALSFKPLQPLSYSDP